MLDPFGSGGACGKDLMPRAAVVRGAPCDTEWMDPATAVESGEEISGHA